MPSRTLKTKRIGVLMGGISSERDVSLRSGMAIFRALKSRKYSVVEIDVGKDLCSIIKRKRVECAFIALHGGYGENGSVQGMLEVMDIPYTGSGILASALAMDKEASKKVFSFHGIPIPPFRIVQRSEKTSELRTKDFELKTGFSMPWVIKPASEGSSVGVNIVKKHSQLKRAIAEAFRYNNRAIVEKYIDGKEIHIGILNNSVLGGVEVRPTLEFYNYEAKYTSGLTEYVLPPELDKKTYERSKKAALLSHKALSCGGATRVDLRVDRKGNPFVLEVNTIPGMTETSLLPKIAKYAGFDFADLLEKILEEMENEQQEK
jgi:D-alanine-D-alanine ligase